MGPPDITAPAEARAEHRNRVEEQQVRLAAQDILIRHLHPDRSTFWPDTDLNLKNATLIDIRMDGCRVRRAEFGGAKFVNEARLDQVEFIGDASFDHVQFSGHTLFNYAQFSGHASFNEAEFSGSGLFDHAKFSDATFDRVQFSGYTSFSRVQFSGHATFDQAWVYLDRPKRHLLDQWPSGWTVKPVKDRPDGVTEGTWGILVESTSPPDQPHST